MAAVTICSDFGAPQNKICHCYHFSPSICHEVMEPDARILVFWMLKNFKPAFSLSPHLHQKTLWFLFAFCHTVVSSAYPRLLMFLLVILIPACASSNPAFLMMSSACKLNSQGHNIQPWGTPFPILNQCIVPCPVLTIASWPAYRFLRKQVRWSGILISLRGGHSGEFWQNVIHWRREWQTTPVYLPWESHELYKRPKR